MHEGKSAAQLVQRTPALPMQVELLIVSLWCQMQRGLNNRGAECGQERKDKAAASFGANPIGCGIQASHLRWTSLQFIRCVACLATYCADTTQIVERLERCMG